MVIFGSKYIESPKIVTVDNIEEISKTSPKDILLLSDFTPPYDLAKYCQKNRLAYCVEVNSINEAVYASSFGASFAIADFDLAKILQKIADNYLWDMKILAKITDEKEIEKVALAEIDGTILGA